MNNQKSAIIFANIMMIFFYISLFGLILSWWLSIINQEIHILTYISSITFILSMIFSVLVERTDNLEGKTNIIYKGKWIWKK